MQKWEIGGFKYMGVQDRALQLYPVAWSTSLPVGYTSTAGKAIA